jgi:hypothetical protein
MKLLLIGVILSFNITASAAADDPSECKHCVRSLSGTPDKAVPGDLRKIASYTPLTKLQKLGGLLCQLYTDSRDIPKDATQIMTNYLNENTSIKPTNENIVKFINKNQDEMDCSDELGLRRNYVKMAIKGNTHRTMISDYLMDTLLLDDVMLDFNAVDIVNGQPETVLDYLDSVLDGSAGIKVTENMRKEFNNLRFTLSDEEDGFGAKNFKDLPMSVQKRYLEDQMYAKR